MVIADVLVVADEIIQYISHMKMDKKREQITQTKMLLRILFDSFALAFLLLPLSSSISSLSIDFLADHFVIHLPYAKVCSSSSFCSRTS